uniref:WRKY domain-containing protein n=2 Tax=Oryza TaxID=4527 RepID=A0A0D3GQM5_9ORYZ
MASGAGGGTAATERLIRSAQKSTNQLKALLAGGGGGGGRSSGAVEVILADISDLLSQALASLMLRAACDDQSLPAAAAPPPPPEASLLPSYGQCVVANSGGRSVSKRKAQRRSLIAVSANSVYVSSDLTFQMSREDTEKIFSGKGNGCVFGFGEDGSSRRIILELGDRDDSYPWRKSYYRCAQMLGCTARKQVQQSDDDPSRLEITYIGLHTCGGDLPSALQQKLEEHVPAASDDMMMACTPSWLFIPSPACSQSELLSEGEVPELRVVRQEPDDPVELVEEHKKPSDADEDSLALHDSVVPDFMAQKSTNQLKVMVANLLPPAMAKGGGAGSSAGVVEVEVILSDIADSLSQALASLQLGGQADGTSRTIMLQYGDRDPGDAYPWRKYGHKGILGTRFPRNYYRCGQILGCTARKQVQQSDDDPSRVEITYIGAHTCGGDRPSSPAATNPADGPRCDAATSSHRLLPSALQQKLEEHVPAWSSDDVMMMACTPSWVFIPSPACSQSELLSEAAVPELRRVRQDAFSPDDPVDVEVEEHKKPCDADDEFLAFHLHDSVVPDFM